MKNKKRLDQFKKWCKHYQKLYGLEHWGVYCKEYKPEDETIEASTDADYVGKCASIRLNPDHPNPEGVKTLARHEMLHVAGAGMDYLCRCRYVIPDQIFITHEEEVRRLENIIEKLENGH